MKHYPSYRFHKDGHLALVRTKEEDEALKDWHETPPEGYVCPSNPHFVGIDDMPGHLLELGDTDEEEEEDKPIPKPAAKPKKVAGYKL